MRSKPKLKTPKRGALKLCPLSGPELPPTACWLDRMADMELQHGHHVRAEYLARRAAALREGVR